MRNAGATQPWALYIRAIRERWPFPDGIVQAALDAALDCLTDPNAGHRAKLHAARFVLEADKVNMEQEKRDYGIPDRLDVTTDGQPIAGLPDLSKMSDDELREYVNRLRAGLAGGGSGVAPPALRQGEGDGPGAG